MKSNSLKKFAFGSLFLIAFVAKATVPAIPSISAPSTSSTGKYQISWSTSSGATRYILQGESSGTLYNSSGTSIDRNKISGTYYYKVKACLNQWSTSCSAYSAKHKVVVNLNRWPVANVDNMTVRENDALSTCKNVLTNDTDPDNDILTITSVWSAQNGTSSKSGTKACYKPKKDFSGTDNFSYSIKDPGGKTATAKVSVTVTANSGPRAIDDNFTIEEINEETCLTVLNNDWDPDEDNLTIYAVWSVPNGIARINDNSICYIPDEDFTGVDNFDYSIKDDRGKTATANVSITVPNSGPRAIADDVIVEENSSATCINVLDNDWDPDNDNLIIYSVWSVPNGSAVINDNEICYTPNTDFIGTDDFDYSIKDGRGKTASANVLVTVQPNSKILSFEIELLGKPLVEGDAQ